MAIRETGIYTEPTTYNRTSTNGPEFRTEAEATSLSEIVRKLTADLGTMISLKIDLLKIEIKESMAGYAKDGVMLAIAAVMGIFAVVFFNFVLMFGLAKLFPVEAPLNYALGALAVTLIYAIGAAALFMIAKKRMAKRSVVPERSIHEMKRDKQWITETLA